MDETRTQTATLFPVLTRVLKIAAVNNNRVTLLPEEVEFLKNFLRTPDTFLQFQCHKTGRMIPKVSETPTVGRNFGVPYTITTHDEPEYFTHYAMAGEELELFMMFTEAVSLNPMFARLVEMTNAWLHEHVPHCPDCSSHHNPDRACHWPDDADPDRFTFKTDKR